MKEKTRKLLTWICLGLAIIGSIFAIVFAMNIEKNSGMYNIAYGIVAAFVVLSIVAILAFVLVQFIKNFKDNPKKAMKSIYVLIIAVVVCLVSFLLASGTDVSQALLDKNNLTESTSKWIGAACILVYILVIAAICSIIFVEVSKLIKKK